MPVKKDKLLPGILMSRVLWTSSKGRVFIKDLKGRQKVSLIYLWGIPCKHEGEYVEGKLSSPIWIIYRQKERKNNKTTFITKKKIRNIMKTIWKATRFTELNYNHPVSAKLNDVLMCSILSNFSIVMWWPDWTRCCILSATFSHHKVKGLWTRREERTKLLESVSWKGQKCHQQAEMFQHSSRSR